MVGIKPKVYWLENENKKRRGELLFSFDRIKVFNYYRDYPNNLSEEELKIFNKYEPFWANREKYFDELEN